jgi:GNAT superfamily N-acetyltransferase
MSKIRYQIGGELDLDQVIDVLNASTLGERRPVNDRARMELMLKHGNLIVTAWDGEFMVGFSRSLSDFAFATYLSDLAVRVSHQKHGIGKELIRITQEEGGKGATLILLAAPAAEKYYPRIGMVHNTQCWILPSEEKLPMYRERGFTDRTRWEL